ncbi:MAG: hypothetical protein J6T96_14940 [Bacteroidales bacterium]|nr:hypothetical protein [Bacteroidales bacterium]
MNAILYIQSQPTDIIIIDDNEPLPFSSDNDEHIDAAKLFSSTIDWMKIPPKQMDGNLRCYRSEKGIYIQSNYLEKDDVGRLIMFRFYTSEIELDSACKTLIGTSAKVGHNCNKQEINALLTRQKINGNSFMFYRDKLVDENGNIVNPNDSKHNSMMSKFEQKGNRKLEKGFYFLKESRLPIFGSDKILFIQSVFDNDYKFWIKNPQSIDDTISHLNNLSKYFDKSVSEIDIKTLQSKSNYGE